ncbi:ubiquitin related modifier 1 [Auriscalpium vulgare]|uniref:Ubiquitin related modifier 1 n=1 Tax=Auriscalpium vulgare TaxID=40419 RepID=A0ACB8RII3_9AGAM|nr:ubiquitin related modifier 1 [Auriscalpium vulgare]
MTDSQVLNLKVEFGGGLELLFDKKRSHRVALPSPPSSPPDAAKKTPADINFLIHWLKDNLLRERAELFIENGTVRPGILVLVNDTDWELEGEGEYVLQEGDEIVFISTLHGG